MEHYFQPEIECAPVEKLREIQNKLLPAQVQHVWDNVPYYRKKMQEKGQSPFRRSARPQRRAKPVVELVVKFRKRSQNDAVT